MGKIMTTDTRNTTDYEFPDSWGLMTDEQKADWYTTERVRRQAHRQSIDVRDPTDGETVGSEYKYEN